MRRRRSCRCRFVRCRTGRARREPAGWPGIDRSGCRVAFCGERAKDRRGKSKVGETGQVGNGLSVSVCRQCVRVNALRGRETTRAIRAVQMSAGDKDRSASTTSVVRSRRPDHVTQPWSTNTARLICWRIWRNQVPATFSAVRVTSGSPITQRGELCPLGLSRVLCYQPRRWARLGLNLVLRRPGSPIVWRPG